MRNQICAPFAVALAIAGAAAGCERKQTTEPVTVDHRKTVVPPDKAHLAQYVAELPGSGQQLTAKIETPQGTITCELWPDRAPMTVANFVGLATGKKAWKNPTNGNIEIGKPFYDGLTFHRVIPDFMIQGGDPLGTGGGGPGYKFADETSPNDRMEIGSLAMANAGPTTNGSQFFITESAPSWLNGKHTIFGKCKEIEIIKAITGVPKVGAETPQTPVTMKVTISKS
jgi:peptidyl-prolyl cis-trans isomerase A (cyclophilin A)